MVMVVVSKKRQTRYEPQAHEVSQRSGRWQSAMRISCELEECDGMAGRRMV